MWTAVSSKWPSRFSTREEEKRFHQSKAQERRSPAPVKESEAETRYSTELRGFSSPTTAVVASRSQDPKFSDRCEVFDFRTFGKLSPRRVLAELTPCSGIVNLPSLVKSSWFHMHRMSNVK